MEAPTQKKEYIDLNVALLPDKNLSLKLIEWSKLVSSRYKTNYILDMDKHLPHLSLYSARYPLKNRFAVEEVVLKLSKNIKSFNIFLKGFSLANLLKELRIFSIFCRLIELLFCIHSCAVAILKENKNKKEEIKIK